MLQRLDLRAIDQRPSCCEFAAPTQLADPPTLLQVFRKLGPRRVPHTVAMLLRQLRQRVRRIHLPLVDEEVSSKPEFRSRTRRRWRRGSEGCGVAKESAKRPMALLPGSWWSKGRSVLVMRRVDAVLLRPEVLKFLAEEPLRVDRLGLSRCVLGGRPSRRPRAKPRRVPLVPGPQDLLDDVVLSWRRNRGHDLHLLAAALAKRGVLKPHLGNQPRPVSLSQPHERALFP